MLTGFRNLDKTESNIILAAANDSNRDAWVASINSYVSTKKELEASEVPQPGGAAAPISTACTSLTPFATSTTDKSPPAATSPEELEPLPSLPVPPPTKVLVSPPAGQYYSSAGDNPDTADKDPCDLPPNSDPRLAQLLLSPDDFCIDTSVPPVGTGGYGVVHKATRRRDGRVLAVKFFGHAKRDPASISVWDEINVMLKLKGSEAFVQLEGWFFDTHEGMLPGKKFLGKYPGVCAWVVGGWVGTVDILMCSAHGCAAVIVMEFVDHDLLSYLASHSSAETVLPIVFRELVEGLAHLHSHRLIHRYAPCAPLQLSVSSAVTRAMLLTRPSCVCMYMSLGI